jgi:hypothetical protein
VKKKQYVGTYASGITIDFQKFKKKRTPVTGEDIKRIRRYAKKVTYVVKLGERKIAKETVKDSGSGERKIKKNA